MVKFTKSNPNSKRKGVKKKLCHISLYFSVIYILSLTAMKLHWGLFKFNHFAV